MVNPDPFPFLASLQAWHLKHLAFLAGLNSTGTKAQLRTTLTQRLSNPRFSKPTCRILSVDMGVKNLAFCLLDVENTSQISIKAKSRASLHMSDWRRLDISERLMAKHTETTLTPSGLKSVQVDNNDKTDDPSPNPVDLYAPSSLSKIAFGLASEFLLHRPDFILIERQRFRSGGGPAIQEWTVRVNMLESMLWASLETMRHGYGKGLASADVHFPELLEMSPRRVGMFWLGRDDMSATPANVQAALAEPKKVIRPAEPEAAKKSFEKKDKIALARHWLSSLPNDLTINEDLAPLVESFCSPRARHNTATGKRGKKGAHDTDDAVELRDASAISALGKLDDLADCLVQAITFALWEQNRTRIRRHIKSQQ